MKRTRINVKLIAFVLGMSVFAVVVIGGMLYLRGRGDVTRHIQMGDEYMAEGDAARAASYYARAVGREPGNAQYLRKFQEALLQVRPESSDHADRAYAQWLTSLRQDADYRPLDPETHLRLLRHLHDDARLMTLVFPRAAADLWQQISIRGDEMLNRLPQDEPMRAYGKLYRGMATLRLTATTPEEDLLRAEQDLLRFLELHPNHDLGWAALVRGQVALADYLAAAGQQRRSEPKFEEAQRNILLAVERVPDGPHVRLVWFISLLQHAREILTGPPEGREALIEDARITAEHVRRSGDPWMLVEFAEILRLIGLPEAYEIAAALYEEHVEENPEAIAHRYFLANLRYRANQLDEAERLAEETIATGPVPVSFVSRMQLQLRRLAAGLIVDVAHQRWSLVQGGDVRTTEGTDDGTSSLTSEQAIAAIEQARDQLLTFVTDPANDAHMIRAEAKLAMARNQHAAAAAGFERLVREGAADAETYTLAAFCLEQIGQLGLAHERIVGALALRGANRPWLTFQKARMEYLMGRFEEASKTLADYIAMWGPDSGVAERPDVARLAAAITARAHPDAGGGVSPSIARAQAAAERGDFEEARAILLGALTAASGDAPPDPTVASLSAQDEARLLERLATLEINAGNLEEASRHVARALQLFPNHPALRQLQHLIDAPDTDPIEAAKRYTESMIPDEADRAVTLLLSLSSIMEHHERAAEHHEAADDTTAAERSRQVATRARAMIPEHLEAVRRLAPDHRGLLEYEYTDAESRQDWVRAEQLVERARRTNADDTEGLLYRGRYELARRRFDQAVRTFQQATDLRPFASQAWRGLAVSYQMLGNFSEAQRAFEQAHRINPSEISTIRQYLGLLVTMGEGARALPIARQAHRLAPDDTRLREMWLDLESEFGGVEGLTTSLTERRTIYGRIPEDRVNALRLAFLLGTKDPPYEKLRNPDGTRMYTERRWRQLAVSDQHRQLANLRQQWRSEADRLVGDIIAREGLDLEIAMLRALLRREQGDVAGGEAILREFVAAQPPGAVTAEMLVSLSQYQNDSGNPAAALETLREAAKYQSERLEADLAIGHYYFGRGLYEQALEHFLKVAEAEPNDDLQIRIAEAYANLQQFDQALATLQHLSSPGQRGQTLALLRAMIAHGKAQNERAAGRSAEAERLIEERRAHLAAAEQLNPSSPMPHIVRARMLVNEHRSAPQSPGSRALLEDALAALSRADAVRPGDVQTSLLRSDIHRIMGDVRLAVAELTRVLERQPTNASVRRLLMQLHLETENVDAARNVITQATELYPSAAVWHELLGNLHSLNDENLRAAAAAYLRAWEIDRSPILLYRHISAVMRAAEGPGPAAQQDLEHVVRLLSAAEQREHVRQEPMLGAVYAVTLHRIGRSVDAARELGRSYRGLRELIASEERSADALGNWYSATIGYFVDRAPADGEQLIRELGADAPGGLHPIDLQVAANLWASPRGGGSAGFARAIEVIREALTLAESAGHEDVAPALAADLARFAFPLGQMDTAADAYRIILKQQPDNVLALNNLAFLLAERLDDPKSALPLASRAAELAPGVANILDTLGCVHYRLGNYKEAEEHLRDSIAAAETAVTTMHLARVLIATDRLEEAVQRLSRAGELRPDPDTAAEIEGLVDDIRTRTGQNR